MKIYGQFNSEVSGFVNNYFNYGTALVGDTLGIEILGEAELNG